MPDRKSKDHSKYQDSSIFSLSRLPWDVLSAAYKGPIPDLRPQEVVKSKLLLTIISWVNRGMSETCPARKEISGRDMRGQQGERGDMIEETQKGAILGLNLLCCTSAENLYVSTRTF